MTPDTSTPRTAGDLERGQAEGEMAELEYILRECPDFDTRAEAVRRTARALDGGISVVEALTRIVSYYDARRFDGRLPTMDSQADCEHEATMFGEARAAIARAALNPEKP